MAINDEVKLGNRGGSRTHGMSTSRVYKVWYAMRRRCHDPGFISYPAYGAKGIRVCAKWHEFQNFHDDIGHGWRSGLTIERIDSAKDYEPGNCTWIERRLQNRNRSMTIWCGDLTLTEECARRNLSYRMVIRRRNLGWPRERWFEEPHH